MSAHPAAHVAALFLVIAVCALAALLLASCAAGPLDLAGTPPPSRLGTPPPSTFQTPPAAAAPLGAGPTAEVVGTVTR